MSMRRRLLAALAIFVVIYLLGFGMGAVLYATGLIGTGPLHTECEDYRAIIAEREGIDEEDVEQEQIKELAVACHEAEKAQITEREAFRAEYLFWPLWPAAIVVLTTLPALSRRWTMKPVSLVELSVQLSRTVEVFLFFTVSAALRLDGAFTVVVGAVWSPRLSSVRVGNPPPGGISLNAGFE